PTPGATPLFAALRTAELRIHRSVSGFFASGITLIVCDSIAPVGRWCAMPDYGYVLFAGMVSAVSAASFVDLGQAVRHRCMRR
ncbi:MAG: hypothetical protein ABI277_01680, partial [Burkholderiaceae bacterium]